jgi:hypothetical protein
MDTYTDFMVTSIEQYKRYSSLTGEDVYLLFRDFGVFDVLAKHKDIEMLLDDDELVKDIDAIIKSNGGAKIAAFPRR